MITLRVINQRRINILFKMGLLFVLLIIPIGSSFSIFGNESGYLLPCHCANGETCDERTGECPSGECEELQPPGFGWIGPACQLGNIGYLKLAESNTVVDAVNQLYNKAHLWHSADFLLDGKLETNVFGGSCSVIYTATKEDLAWWMVDLGDVYAIRNITIVNTENSVDSTFLETFDITVGNTSDRSEHGLCTRHAGRVEHSAHEGITCDSLQVGRYLAIAKYEERNRVGRLPMCEVIIMGHKWLPVDWKWCADPEPNTIWCETCYGDTSVTCSDAPCEAGTYGVGCSGICGHCANDTLCDRRRGNCVSCAVGWKPPLCQDQCDQGFFGFHCLRRCGHCLENKCDIKTGACHSGCQLWYLGERCDVLIKQVDLNFETEIHSLFEKDSSVILQLRVPPPGTDENHSIIVDKMDEHNPLTGYTRHRNITWHYNNETFWLKILVSDLHPDTQYWFRVAVSRNHFNITEIGKPAPAIKVTTRIQTSGTTRTSDPVIAQKNVTNPPPTDDGISLVSTIRPNALKTQSHPLHKELHIPVIIGSVGLGLLIVVVVTAVYLWRRHTWQRRVSPSGSDGCSLISM